MTYLIAPSLIEGGMFFAARQQHRAVCSFHAGAKVCLSFLRHASAFLFVNIYAVTLCLSFSLFFNISLPLHPTHPLFISDFIFLSLIMSSFTRFLSLSLSVCLLSLSFCLCLCRSHSMQRGILWI